MAEEKYLDNSLIPNRYKGEILLRATNESDNIVFKNLNDIKLNIKKFINSGNNLLLYSKHPGNGKTSWAIKLLKAYIHEVSGLAFKNDTPALFININSFLNEKKLSISDPCLENKVRQIERNILSAKLVIFDDIADKNLSEYDMNTMYYWIDYRTANLKSCIYTTNQTPEELKKSLSPKVYSRIVNYSKQMYISGSDMRGVGD